MNFRFEFVHFDILTFLSTPKAFIGNICSGPLNELLLLLNSAYTRIAYLKINSDFQTNDTILFFNIMTIDEAISQHTKIPEAFLTVIIDVLYDTQRQWDFLTVL